VIGGAAAAAGAAVVVARGGDDDSGSNQGPGERPTPTPAPTPEPTRDVSGRWAGSFVENPSAVQCSVSAGLEATLQQESPAAASGSFVLTIRSATPAPQDPCPVAAGDSFSGPAGLSLAGASVELRLAIPGGGPEVVLQGVLEGETMGGTSPPDSGGPGGTWELTRQ
jgi:hypothetical protein